jgi:hypothetical protein
MREQRSRIAPTGVASRRPFGSMRATRFWAQPAVGIMGRCGVRRGGCGMMTFLAKPPAMLFTPPGAQNNISLDDRVSRPQGLKRPKHLNA